ncbi:hypothetical protein CCACVL1_14378 [Corchorus capsularis]|uniref:Poly [ADP-ribose] polymerase n=1 Tax=Corchorus capsularis TaxID=210143 RepID=A0A1R3I784_COCAP|nr:hypothetical protein CCACVL1_14378 [Corchorus capsularis]
MAANPLPKPWKAEYAKSDRLSCKTCKNIIAMEVFRLGKMVLATQFYGFMPMWQWHHANCILQQANQINSVDDVEGIESLRWEDQQRIRNYVNNAEPETANTAIDTPPAMGYAIEVSQTSCATCKHCSQMIMKGEVRIASKPKGQGSRGLVWNHASCFSKLSPATQVEKLPGWESLSSSDQATVVLFSGKGTEVSDDNQPKSTSKAGTKRKMDVGNDQRSKVTKLDGNVPTDRAGSAKNIIDLTVEGNVLTDRAGSAKNIIDLTVEGNVLTERAGSAKNIIDLTVEGNVPTDRAGSAKNIIDLTVEGNVPTDWAGSAKYIIDLTVELPKDFDLESKLEAQTKELWNLKDDLKKHVTTGEMREMLKANHQVATGSELNLRDRCVDGMMFGALGRCPICSGFFRFSRGMYHCCGYLSAWSKCSYSTREPGRLEGKWKVPDETKNEFLSKWFKSQKVKKSVRILPLPSASSSQAATGQSQTSKAESLADLKVSFAGLARESVEEWTSKIEGAGGLIHAKIRKDTNCFVVRGELDGHDAEIRTARRMKLPIVREGYLVDCFKRQKKLPFDLHKVQAIGEASSMVTVKVKGRSAVHEASGLQDSCHILEDGGSLYNTTMNMSDLSIRVNRAAMMEFEINMSEMPLGKLSKTNIQKGFEALTEIQNLLNSNAYDPSVKESLIIDASNRFFTVIPSIHPHVIRDEDDFKSKVKMLEALQDIEIASRLVGLDGEFFDEKYKKLNCGIVPLPHDSEEYQLIKKYFLTTQVPTHFGYTLELEEVFSLEREGEFDKFAPYREKLNNRMLLWHGSRLTNFVGILSQGLRIAPPEAPKSGYMFGKGIYFADLVSKSAPYCYTDRKNPVGLMLLSEVALGEVYELTTYAQHTVNLPRGKHSTKGLGQKVPQTSEFVKWKDGVTVPCPM